MDDNKYLERSDKCLENCKGISGIPFIIGTVVDKIAAPNSRPQFRYKFRPRILLNKLSDNNDPKLPTRNIPLWIIAIEDDKVFQKEPQRRKQI